MTTRNFISQPKSVCRYFGTPQGCPYGPRCKFRHVTSPKNPRAGPSQIVAGPPSPYALPQVERNRFNHWLEQTPETRPPVGLGSRLSPWIKAAQSFVAGENVELRQRIIERLSTEGGLTRIVEVLNAAPAMPIDIQQGQQYLQDLATPLLAIFGDAEVANSLLLEAAVERIHNMLYGTGGIRSLTFFTTLCDVMVSQNGNIRTLVDVVADALTVLLRIVELNGGAKLIEGYLEIIGHFESLLSDTEIGQFGKVAKARLTLRRIAAIMNVGLSLPYAQENPRSLDEQLAVFDLNHELPGRLRNEGPRHDNDHDNVADIAIMPTKNQLEALEADYLPGNDPRRLHLPGIEGLIDRQFRLLREDSVGQLRDAIRSELHQLRHISGTNPFGRAEKSGARVMVYRDVHLEDFVLGKDHLAIRMSFRQPENLSRKSQAERQAWWESSRSLMEDSLVCLLGPDGFTAFASICRDPGISGGPQVKQCPKGLYQEDRRAITFLRLVDPHGLSFRRVDACFSASQRQALVLCEFPGVLLPSFYHTLDALKTLSRKLDVPFAGLLAPESTLERVRDVNAPMYARTAGFKFDLSALIDGKDTLELEVGRRLDFDLLHKHSTLDDGQQQAIVHALTKEFALIQGPPGCGKSFTGVAIVKTLLANKRRANLGPLICVCYTNHALDQLLEHLVKEGVKQIVRIGSRSKSEVLKAVNLRDLSRNVAATPTERRRCGQLYGILNDTTLQIESNLKMLKDAGSWTAICAYLADENESHLHQLQGLNDKKYDSDGFKVVTHDNRPALDKWLRPRLKKATLQSSTDRSPGQLQSVALDQMTLAERRRLYDFWHNAIKSKHKDILVEILKEYGQTRKAQQVCFREQDLRCLAQADVVGLTTSGLAKNLDMLRRVKSKVLLCEEAGEVLEAHLLTALLPSIEHCILIGDHEQLRPQTQNYELQVSNPRGERFSLDVSLFERLINPPFDHMPQLQYSTLERQRRMHPSISDLIRQTRYPKLQDDETVLDYPPVFGMSRRLFWLNHQHPEEPKDQARSYSNLFEVDMVAALVSHLISQCKYRSEDIAVLTPYLGQMRKLRRKLSAMYDIVVDDRDEAELQKQGAAEEETSGSGPQNTARSSLLQALRLATVDNFQGEEAKIIVISLVRSNDKKKCGFLSTTNRTNVLLSRAQHGMYLIGDASNYEAKPMWQTVIQLLRESGNLGTALTLECPRHPQTPITVSTPDDFLVHSPEGGCSLHCADRLDCGHQCPNKCHAKARHDIVFCQEECLRPRTGCEHLCSKACGSECGRCEQLVENVLLPCGHISPDEQCYVKQNLRLATCQVLVEREMPGCQHRIQLPCHIKVDDSTKCTAICATQLNCQHVCKRRCYQCRRREDGEITSIVHTECQTECGNQYSLCGHHCTETCHRNHSECDPCQAKCQTHCRHSSCSKACSEPCAPCAEPCRAGCEHNEVCELPCAVPCDILPCSRRCERLLACGCKCPTVCGETCPDTKYCQNCCGEAVREMTVDYTDFSSYGELELNRNPCYVLPCGHIMAMTMLDGLMDMASYYEMTDDGHVTALKGQSKPFTAKVVHCPECRHPVQNLQRYNRIWRRAMLDESTKKFIAWSTSTFVPLSQAIDEAEQTLVDDSTLGLGTQDVRRAQERPSLVSHLNLSGTSDEIICVLRGVSELRKRYSSILVQRKRVKQYLRQVTEGEQPVGRVREMLESVRRQRGGDGLGSASAITGHVVLPSKQRLLATSLSIRCDLVILTDFVGLRREHAGLFAAKYDWRAVTVTTNFSQVYEVCEALSLEADTLSYPMIQVEALMYFVLFACLERTNVGASGLSPAIQDRIEEARQKIDIAKDVCKAHPKETPGMLSEIEAAEKAIREQTFYEPISNEEKKNIIAAMKTEFSVNGHWYYCPNGHPFTIGECGRAMQQSRCPECGAVVGGGQHRLVDGNRAADDIAREFGGLGL